MLDISSMPSVTGESFDIVFDCNVLEHVPDDLAEMKELHRILRHGGTAILSNHQMDPPATTAADPSITDPRERESVLGRNAMCECMGMT
jgi:2-polyprenyl-3-methyl-5-hydroxy-6-metoxy-1,4-benzoquinol methylase